MKVLILLFALAANHAYSQNVSVISSQKMADSLYEESKLPIDTAVYNIWTSIEGAKISNNGRYSGYTLINKPKGGKTLVIQSTDTKWRYESESARNEYFTADSKFCIFSKDNSLCILKLGTSFLEFIGNISSYKTIGSWLAWKEKGPSGVLTLRNLITGKEQLFRSVSSFIFSENGEILVLQLNDSTKLSNTQILNWIDLSKFNTTTIWRGEGLNNIQFDNSSSQMAFTINDKGKSIWYFKKGMGKAVLLANDSSRGIDNNIQIDNIERFSKDNSRIFITLKSKNGISKFRGNHVNLNIWSYTDLKLQSKQLKEQKSTIFKGVLLIKSNEIIRLQHENEEIEIPADPMQNDDWAIVNNIEVSHDEKNWNKGSKNDFCRISTIDGKKVCEMEINKHWNFFSEGGRFIIYYDGKEKDFYSYEVQSGIVRNITKGIAAIWTLYEDDHVDASKSCYAPAGWVRNDSAVWLYDQNDIWEIDPIGIKPPINLTNGYGKKNDIELRLVSNNLQNSLMQDGEVLLTAFCRRTKDNGFFKMTLGIKKDPGLLSMGPYIYYAPNIQFSVRGERPIKAKNAKAYIVQRMSATESPNYLFTKDFKSFIPLSTNHPESQYKWYKNELHRWKSLDGKTVKGILYKPIDFDTTKKYPVIFYFYEKISDGLNAFLKPDYLANSCAINIPSYVSRNYLVFSPDIHYVEGDPMQGTFDDVISATEYISKFPFVNPQKLALQGCSWGAIQTNYLITHSNLFAAACSSSGIANWVSGYGSILPGGDGMQGLYEHGQNRMGKSLWDIPAQYIKNSSVLNVDKVTTPLLMMHTPNDGICPFSNAMELFTGLRRLGKRAWMLEYEDGNHGVYGKSAIDFSLRMMQFFDHYLKDMPPPQWMTKGVPAKMKGIDNGLNLDYEIKTPGEGLIPKGDVNLQK